MAKKINIIARSNGVGLDSDTLLITEALKEASHHVTFSHCRTLNIFNKWFKKRHQYDVNLFLERVFPLWFSSGRKNILIPNQERFPARHINRLKRIDSVFCKSQHAYEIFSPLAKSSELISFTSKDILKDEIKTDYSQFFHLAGSSTLKGTETILKLWQAHPEWPNLTILQHKHNAPANVPRNVNLITDHLIQDDLVKLANQKGIHLCTSRSEGWGHYIVEAMSARALVITTDAPPMNELISNERGITIPYSKNEPRHLGINYYIDEQRLENEIQNVISMTNEEKAAIGINARQWYKQNDAEFRKRIINAIDTLL